MRADVECAALSSVIASEAKQSRIFPLRDSGLLRCTRNDDLEGTKAPTNLLARGCFQTREQSSVKTIYASPRSQAFTFCNSP
ncbi:hypothetical protein ACVWXQ_004539 [Bradyrhizobium sp. S3.14.4]